MRIFLTQSLQGSNFINTRDIRSSFTHASDGMQRSNCGFALKGRRKNRFSSIHKAFIFLTVLLDECIDSVIRLGKGSDERGITGKALQKRIWDASGYLQEKILSGWGSKEWLSKIQVQTRARVRVELGIV